MEKKILFLAIVVFSLTACTSSKIYNSASDLPVFLGVPPTGQKYKVVKHVKAGERVCWDYTASYDVGPLMREEITTYQADGMINVTWKEKMSFTSGVLNIFTLGIANCKDVELEGSVIKFEK